jgi:hypothetical protein
LTCGSSRLENSAAEGRASEDLWNGAFQAQRNASIRPGNSYSGNPKADRRRRLLACCYQCQAKRRACVKKTKHRHLLLLLLLPRSGKKNY